MSNIIQIFHDAIWMASIDACLMYRRILDGMLPCLRAWRSIVITWGTRIFQPESNPKREFNGKELSKSQKTIDVTYGLWIICHNVNQCDQLINMSHRSFFWHLFQSWVARFLHLFSFLEQAPGFPGISENLHPNQHGEESGTISPLLGAFHKSFLNGFDGCVYPPSTSPAQMSQTHGLPEFFQAEIRCNTGEMYHWRGLKRVFPWAFLLLTSVFFHDLWQPCLH